MQLKSFGQRSLIVLVFVAGGLVSGCGLVPESGQQLEAGIHGAIDATPTNAQLAERRARFEPEGGDGGGGGGGAH
ncbi:hypothetical protein [Hoeflea sp.]|uniref:hypothetical protein n=1 Tax=Hoeflea sp. TaxID=1940281 RepID=UPI003BAF294B